jgi:undecaprenyl-diphosphatase
MEFLNLLKGWDKDLLLFFNGHNSPLWDYSMTLFTLTPTWLLFYGMILIIIGRKYDKKSILIFVAITLLILCADQFAGVLKHSIQRLRPSNDPSINQYVRVFFEKGGQFGFVSAHAANAFAFATFSIMLFKNSRYTAFIIPWAILVAYTRIYLGVHYPGDILGGALLGIVIGVLIYKLLIIIELRVNPVNLLSKNHLKDKEANQIIMIGLFVIIMSISIVSLMLSNQLLTIKV